MSPTITKTLGIAAPRWQRIAGENCQISSDLSSTKKKRCSRFSWADIKMIKTFYIFVELQIHTTVGYVVIQTKGRILNDTSYPNITLPQFEFWRQISALTQHYCGLWGVKVA